MLCIDDEVAAALLADPVLVGLLGGPKIYLPDTPGTENAFTAVFYDEVSNVPDFASDDLEIMSRITYQLSIYSESDLIGIINAAERVMISLNFVRHSSDPLARLPMGVRGKKILFVTIREVI